MGLLAMATDWETEVRRIAPAIPLAALARTRQPGDPIHVLLVEEDRDYRMQLASALARFGFDVQGFADSRSLLGALDAGGDADIVLVPARNPQERAGADLLIELRRHGVDLPVIFLTGRTVTGHASLTLDKVAIDSIDGPPAADVLARPLEGSSEAGKMSNDSPSDTIMIGSSLVLKPDVSRAYWNGVDVDLTRGEFNIVHYLVSNAGRFLTYRSIYDRLHYEGFVAGSGADGYRVNVRSAIKRIRSKFRQRDPGFAEIRTYSGFGYCWRNPQGAP
jgi:two-component system, OmpR family, response regulator ChvI